MKFRCTFSFFLRSRSSFFQRKLKPTIASRCDERIDGVRCSFRVVKEKLRTNREKREDKGNEDRRKKKKRKEDREKKEKDEGNGFFFAVPIDFHVVAITGGVWFYPAGFNLIPFLDRRPTHPFHATTACQSFLVRRDFGVGETTFREGSILPLLDRGRSVRFPKWYLPSSCHRWRRFSRSRLRPRSRPRLSILQSRNRPTQRIRGRTNFSLIFDLGISSGETATQRPSANSAAFHSRGLLPN